MTVFPSTYCFSLTVFSIVRVTKIVLRVSARSGFNPINPFQSNFNPLSWRNKSKSFLNEFFTQLNRRNGFFVERDINLLKRQGLATFWLSKGLVHTYSSPEMGIGNTNFNTSVGTTQSFLPFGGVTKLGRSVANIPNNNYFAFCNL